MATRVTWADCIEALDPHVHQSMFYATQETIFPGELPPDLAFLKGRWTSLGFERLNLAPEKLVCILKAYCSTGVAIPGTHWRLRFVYPFAVVELADGTENETLPWHWKEGVAVRGDTNLVWVGKRSPSNWIAALDLDEYQDAGEGWFRICR